MPEPLPASPPHGAAPAPAERRAARLLPFVLAAVAAVFWPALRGELVYDDLQVVAENTQLESLANVPRFFTQGYWDFLGPEDARFTGYWRPLTATAMALAQAIGGPRPESFHALSLLVHLGAVAAAFLLARRLTGSAVAGLLAALLFGLHPVQVESVAWITAVNDPLCGLLSILALLAFLRWRDAGSQGLPFGAALLLALALLAKEMGVAVLPMAAAVDLGRRRAAAERPGLLGGLATAPLRAYGTLGCVLVLYLAARMAVFGSVWAGLDRVATDFGVGLGRLALLRLEVLGGALHLLAWPAELSLFHRFRPHVSPGEPALLSAAAWTAALAAGVALALRRGARTLGLALLLVPAALVPVLLRAGSLGRFPLSERFLYLAVLGFGLAVAVAALRWLPRRAAVAAVLAVAALHAWRSHERTGVWRDEETLFRAAALESPRSPYALWGLGRVLLVRYHETGERAYLEDAFDVYDRAARLVEEERRNPRSDVLVTLPDLVSIEHGQATVYLLEAETDPYRDYGTPIALLGKLIENVHAIRERGAGARTAAGLAPGEEVELEHVHVTLASALMRAEKLAAAEDALRAALAENPRSAEAHRALGRLHALRGDFDRARQHLARAVEIRPRDVESRLALAQVLREGGWSERAEDLARAIARNAPPAARARANLVVAAARLDAGHPEEALTAIGRALEAAPRLGHAWYLKAAAHLALREKPAALEALGRAVESDPAHFEARHDLGAFLLAEGDHEDAARALAPALALAPTPELAERIERTLDALPFPGPDPAVEVAAALWARRRTEAALAWTGRALEADPAHVPALGLEGRILRALGDREAAAERLARAARESPRDLPLQLELGELFHDLGRDEEAAAALGRVLALRAPRGWSPAEAEAARSRAEALLESMGQRAAAGPAER